MLSDLAPPLASFASDNTAGVHPVVLEALGAASAGPAIPYGDDPWTTRAAERVSTTFDAEVATLFTFGGTGANVVGLASVLQPWEAVICPSSSHLATDECGAAERMAGMKLLPVECPDGKLDPAVIEPFLQFRGDVHHIQPRVVSVTQSTEFGTLYSLDELTELATVAHDHDLLLHVDGARLANAVVALGGDPVAAVRDAGVDVLSFGGTKNGLAYGEAVVFFDPSLGVGAPYIRKQMAQLPSKLRFIAAQFEALLDNGLWLANAGHANAMAARLADGVAGLDGLTLSQRPAVNALFARLPRSAIVELEAWSFFYRWDDDPTASDDTAEVRLMTHFETTADDVDAMVAGITHALEQCRD